MTKPCPRCGKPVGPYAHSCRAPTSSYQAFHWGWLSGETRAVAGIVAWLRGQRMNVRTIERGVTGDLTSAESSHRLDGIADAIERGEWRDE